MCRKRKCHRRTHTSTPTRISRTHQHSMAHAYQHGTHRTPCMHVSFIHSPISFLSNVYGCAIDRTSSENMGVSRKKKEKRFPTSTLYSAPQITLAPTAADDSNKFFDESDDRTFWPFSMHTLFTVIFQRNGDSAQHPRSSIFQSQIHWCICSTTYHSCQYYLKTALTMFALYGFDRLLTPTDG